MVLVGAGKMGSAMLHGWIRIGLDPDRITVLEPHPGPEIVALASRGLSLNPAEAEPATIIEQSNTPAVTRLWLEKRMGRSTNWYVAQAKAIAADTATSRVASDGVPLSTMRLNARMGQCHR